jgi:hypothetical protein
MLRMAGIAALLGIALVVSVSPPAQAQATRTWVSGVGDDANPCSRTAPCKTFAGAISKTAVGGIINCIDPGGFGAVTVTKAITIDCLNTAASILAVGTNGVNINAPNATVVLRGLAIEGGNGAGLSGINFIAGGTVHVERSRIAGFRSGAAIGINFAVPTGVGAELVVSDTTIVDNGSASTNGGIVVRGTGTASTRVTLNRVQLNNNSVGLRVDGSAGTAGGVISLLMRDSTSAANGTAGISIGAGGAATLVSIFDNVGTVGNGTGLVADGLQARALITRVTAVANDTGLSATNGGQIISYLDNHINGNLVANGAPTSTQTPQ